MLAAITFYNVVLFVHIAAVVAAFGSYLVSPALVAAARRSGPAALAAVHRLQGTVLQRVAAWGGAVVLLAGLYLALDGPWDFGDPWIGATLLILVVLLGLSGGYFTPRERRLAELAPVGGREYETLAAQVRAVGLVAALLVLVAIFLMVTKPGA
jgi:uncharacterized membrane protein